MTIDEFCKLHDRPLPADEVLLAAAFLEGAGFQFLVDYNLANVLEIAERVMKQEMEAHGGEWDRRSAQYPELDGLHEIRLRVPRKKCGEPGRGNSRRRVNRF